MTNKEIIIDRILNLSKQQVTEVLFFMAGLSAGCEINMQTNKIEQKNDLHNELTGTKSEGEEEKKS